MGEAEQIITLQKRISQLEAENKSLHESVEYLSRKLFGKSSEKTSALGIEGQLSYFDEAEIFVTGQRPKVDIEVSELNVTILADDFVDGVAEKEVLISNEGSVPCRIKLALKGVPVDLDVTAEVDNDFLLKGETTTLNIRVELSEQKDVEDFNFSILVKASLRP
jgi:hypothetical protein